MQEVERGMLDAKEREKVLFIEMRKEKTSKMMKQKARVKASCTKEGLKEMIQSLRRMRTSAFDYFFLGEGGLRELDGVRVVCWCCGGDLHAAFDYFFLGRGDCVSCLFLVV